MQTHSEGPCRTGSDRTQTHVCGARGGGEKQGEREWWEGDKRERDDGEKRGERGKLEGDRRERDEARRGGERGRGGGRWRGGGKLRREGWGAKQERNKQKKKGERGRGSTYKGKGGSGTNRVVLETSKHLKLANDTGWSPIN